MPCGMLRLRRECRILLNGSNTRDSYNFSIPGSSISLMLRNFHGYLNQGELDLCIIEGVALIVDKIIVKRGDGFLPLNKWTSQYGNTVINIYDYHPPSFQMTWRTIVVTLRSIALFASMYGYVDMDFEVWDTYLGHVGNGEIGEVVPGRYNAQNGTSTSK